MDIRKVVSYWRGVAARRRISFNQVFFAVCFIFLMHPRNRFFFAAGFIVALIGALLRIWAKGTLSRDIQELVTHGPYKLVRHPMYLGTLLECAGLCVASFNFQWFFSWIVLVVFFAGYFLFVYKETMLMEEEKMFARHGMVWESYSQKVPAIFPWWDDVRTLRWRHFASFDFHRFEASKEWNNFLIFIGVSLLLWTKLVYRL